MSLIFKFQEDALDCVQALMRAGRVYKFSRLATGEFEITTRD